MRKIIIHVLACFIFDKKRRKNFRKKYLNYSKLPYKADLLKRVCLLEKQLNLFCARDFPKATGMMRTIQTLNFRLLCEVDRICRKYGLSYWLDFGTLLGAVRHKGFIPWDDDLDISMMKEDYDKFQQIVQNEWGDDSVFALKRVPSVIVKLLYKDFMPTTDQEWIDFVNWRVQKKFFFAMDIFPVYFLKEGVDIETAKKIIQLGQDKKREIYGSEQYSMKLLGQAELFSKQIQKEIEADQRTDYIFNGVDSFSEKPRVWETSDVFPLKEMEFEGRKFFVPNHWHKLLTDYYGDYGELKITHTHLNFENLSHQDYDALLKYKILEEE